MMHRILLVDDHARLRELYRMALQGEPDLQVVAEAEDGEQALRLAREHRPDLVVMDLSMPRRDGLQALQDLKQALPEDRVVVLSGFLRDRVEPLVMEMGANAYVEKGLPARDMAPLLLAMAAQAPRAPGKRFTRSELEQRVMDLV